MSDVLAYVYIVYQAIFGFISDIVFDSVFGLVFFVFVVLSFLSLFIFWLFKGFKI